MRRTRPRQCIATGSATRTASGAPNAYASIDSARAVEAAVDALGDRVAPRRAPRDVDRQEVLLGRMRARAAGPLLAVGEQRVVVALASVSASQLANDCGVAQRLGCRRGLPSSRAGCASRGPSRRSARLRRVSGASARAEREMVRGAALRLQRELRRRARRRPGTSCSSGTHAPWSRPRQPLTARGDAGVLQQLDAARREVGRAGRRDSGCDRAHPEIRRNRGSFPASRCR